MAFGMISPGLKRQVGDGNEKNVTQSCAFGDITQNNNFDSVDHVIKLLAKVSQ